MDKLLDSSMYLVIDETITQCNQELSLFAICEPKGCQTTYEINIKTLALYTQIELLI